MGFHFFGRMTQRRSIRCWVDFTIQAIYSDLHAHVLFQNRLEMSRSSLNGTEDLVSSSQFRAIVVVPKLR